MTSLVKHIAVQKKMDYLQKLQFYSKEKGRMNVHFLPCLYSYTAISWFRLFLFFNLNFQQIQSLHQLICKVTLIFNKEIVVTCLLPKSCYLGIAFICSTRALTRELAQVVECLSSKHKILSSNP
jgi:hypothetical protein